MLTHVVTLFLITHCSSEWFSISCIVKKVKFSLSMLWRHIGDLEIYLLSFLTMVLDVVNGLLHTLAALPPGMNLSIHWIRGLAGPRTRLDASEKRNTLDHPALYWQHYAESPKFVNDSNPVLPSAIARHTGKFSGENVEYCLEQLLFFIRCVI